MNGSCVLPAGITVFERGWLSSNNILVQGRHACTLIDSGYATHARQTCALVEQALHGAPLDFLVNTHLHSDHCGGNAALQLRFPAAQTLIPPGQADAVRNWDTTALTYTTTGQTCERFRLDAVLRPGTEVRLGDLSWQVHAAPGHDPHSVILFEPVSQLLVSADALWENGFGVVFPELEGTAAFDEVAATLDLIERLRPRIVVPGHGRVFSSADGAIATAVARARSRLEGFVQAPARHASHAAKVLLKFKLLELQQMSLRELEAWALQTPYFGVVMARYFPESEFVPWLESLVQGLVKSGAAAVSGDRILNG